jgi:hypothetical protein
LKRFFIYGALFLAVLVGLCYLTDAVVTVGLRKADLPDVPELVQWNDIVSGEAGSELLIQGSSRPWVGVSPAILSDRLGMTSYNLGVNGYPLQMQLARYKFYRRYNDKPRVIVQAVDTHTFTRGEELFANNQFLPYLDEQLIREAVEPYKFFRWYDYYLPLVRYRGKVQMVERGLTEALGISRYSGYDYRGYRPNDWQWSDDFARYVAQHPHGEAQPWEQVWIDSLDAFVAECGRESVVVVFVYLPEYYQAQALTTNRAEIVGMISDIANEHGIEFLDYSSDTMCRDTKYFYNSQHLNTAGAELFSAKLAEDLAPLVGAPTASAGG